MEVEVELEDCRSDEVEVVEMEVEVVVGEEDDIMVALEVSNQFLTMFRTTQDRRRRRRFLRLPTMELLSF